tara:strand:+ start:9188 stop:9451 length:264 start_codon:yes stop_codon:yes gene_type:complete
MINNYEIMINFFNKNKWEQFGYVNFRTFANRIEYELKIKNDYQIRKIFILLKKLGYIVKINIPRKYLYRYDNLEHPKTNGMITIYFD